MKLSELVALKNQLDAMSMVTAKNQLDLELNRVRYALSNCVEEFSQLAEQLTNQRDYVQQQLDTYENLIDTVRQQVNRKIRKQEKAWFEESYRLYEQETPTETTQYILNRREPLTEETQQILLSRLENYADWRFPGMIIRPGLENFIRSMVANDPLYLIDQHRDLLTPAVKQFPEAYQNRLRTYVVNERHTNSILAKIPNEQFGLCLVYNFFNFRPFEIIKQWLWEIQVKLRPGGILIMTINDCDRDTAVMLVESHFACYTPGYLILDMVQSMGFEVLATWNNDGPMTWIELRKPGELTSLRGGQTLAKIVSKTVANSK
jgi:hypothetical protein